MKSTTNPQVNGGKAVFLTDPTPETISIPYPEPPEGNEAVIIAMNTPVTWVKDSCFYVTLVTWPDTATVATWPSDWTSGTLSPLYTITIPSTYNPATLRYEAKFTFGNNLPAGFSQFLCVYNNQLFSAADNSSKCELTPPPPPPNIIIVDQS